MKWAEMQAEIAVVLAELKLLAEQTRISTAEARAMVDDAKAVAEHARATSNQNAAIFKGVAAAVRELQDDSTATKARLDDHEERLRALEQPAKEASGS